MTRVPLLDWIRSSVLASAVLVSACLVLVLSLLVLGPSLVMAQEPAATGPAEPEVVIGMVIDGPWERNDELLPLFRGEIEELVREDFGAAVPDEQVLIADWTRAGVRAAIDRLFADPDVDIVVGLGVLASHELTQRETLPKPALAPVVIDPDAQGLPDAGGKSGIPNLNYLAIPLTLETDIRSFLDIVPFQRMAVLMSRRVMDAIPALGEGIPEAAADLNIQVDVISVTSAQAALDAIPGGTQAVYIAPLHSWAAGELDHLVRGLIDRRLPSFARLDEREVERGFLATSTPTAFFDRLARRLALNVQSVLLGQDPGELRTDFTVPARLTINMETARAIGTYPPWEVVTESVLLNERAQEVARTWNLGNAVREAVQVNLDLAARNQFVSAGESDVTRARARLLPQLEISSFGAVIDEDRASASFGQQSQRTLSGSATFSQLLFSESAWADYSARRSLQDSREYDRDALALDISLEAATAYLNVLRAKTFERIQQENLRLTRTNLEDSRLRERIGAGRPAEVLRWESQIAIDRQAVISASAERNVAEMELNRLLNRPLEERFATEDTDLTDPEISFVGRLYPYADDQWSFDVFRRFMAAEALANAPELRAFSEAIEAQNRFLSSTRRAYWLPTFALQAEVTNVLKRGGAGSAGFAGGAALDSLGFGFTETDDLSWSVGLVGSLPLFEGGKRFAETRQASRELERLQFERGAVAERVEQRARIALHRAGASYVNIDLSRAAANAARRNFELVRDAYAEGAATILDVLDAQNAFLVAELAAANAVYDFIIDFMRVQRGVGGFFFLMSPEDRDVFFERLDRFMSENQP
jgi:outer membrane protein TolC